ncbi:histidine phosphatase family protein [Dongia soli]|uniref:Histidine phosphatase family protein n=1 Tax=Dongia soli TaxID=600628 RepID=A0ABU5E7G6_9PROT|nr:histidine phosphatase family protein [Dongia soli]MDY0881827.1 histidine phosphatase family protein [Dongia soli]
MSADIYLLRHGETEWSQDGRLQGQLDSPLTDSGRRQARQLGALLTAHLAGGELRPGCQVSPLGRAQETANLIRAEAQGLLAPEQITEPRLSEIGFGDWEGLTFDEIEADWADLIDQYDDLGWLFDAPNGEGYERALARIRSWLDDQSGPVIAISHGLTSQLICCAYLGEPRSAVAGFTVEHGVIYRLRDGEIETIRG